jgi:hypothetical protein
MYYKQLNYKINISQIYNLQNYEIYVTNIINYIFDKMLLS